MHCAPVALTSPPAQLLGTPDGQMSELRTQACSRKQWGLGMSRRRRSGCTASQLHSDRHHLSAFSGRRAAAAECAQDRSRFLQKVVRCCFRRPHSSPQLRAALAGQFFSSCSSFPLSSCSAPPPGSAPVPHAMLDHTKCSMSRSLAIKPSIVHVQCACTKVIL